MFNVFKRKQQIKQEFPQIREWTQKLIGSIPSGSWHFTPVSDYVYEFLNKNTKNIKLIHSSIYLKCMLIVDGERIDLNKRENQELSWALETYINQESKSKENELIKKIKEMDL